MRLLHLISASVFFLSCSCLTKYAPKEGELNIGTAGTAMRLPIEGNDLLKYINTKLLTDTSRNLIKQLGDYRFSTSIDAANALDSRYNPDVFIYYDYEGLQLRYVFKGAGMLQRHELQSNLENYRKYIYLDQLIIEPEVYKGSLPYDLSKHFGPLSVERVIGKHNSFFDSVSPSKKISYTYPEKGLFVLFHHYPGPVIGDSTIQFLTITDSISEMKRYPTIYPKYSQS